GDRCCEHGGSSPEKALPPPHGFSLPLNPRPPNRGRPSAMGSPPAKVCKTALHVFLHAAVDAGGARSMAGAGGRDRGARGRAAPRGRPRSADSRVVAPAARPPRGAAGVRRALVPLVRPYVGRSGASPRRPVRRSAVVHVRVGVAAVRGDAPPESVLHQLPAR